MDCDNARLFLPFQTPGGKELAGLSPEETADLHAHLEQCSACNATAMNARRLDAHLGRAMNAVEVPVGLKGRVLTRLADERRANVRRWAKRAGRVAALAAGVLLAAWLGYYYWYAPNQNVVSAYAVHISGSLGAPDHEHVNGVFARLGAPQIAPDFNYDYLVGEPALAELPGHKGKKVPQLVFVRPVQKDDRAGKRTKVVAIVYAIPTGKFPGQHKVIEDMEGGTGDQYRYKIKVKKGDGCKYLILYDGDNCDWLEDHKAR